MPKFSVDIGGRTVTGEVPEGTSQEDAIKQAQQWAAQNPYSGSAEWGDIPRGLAKGALGVGRTIGQLSPESVKGAIRSIPGEATIEQFQKTPSRSWLETGAQYAAPAAAAAAAEYATGGAATPYLGEILGPVAEGMFWSGASSAAEPTQEGTLASHLEHGIEGAATSIPFTGGSAIAKGVGKAISPRQWPLPKYSRDFAQGMEKWGRHLGAAAQEFGIHELARQAGMPISPYEIAPAWAMWNWLHHSPLSDTAARWAKNAAPYVQDMGPYLQKAGRAVERIAPSLVGTGVGEMQE